MLVKEQKISTYILYSLLIITAIVMGLFYLGGVVPETVMSDYPEPIYTDPVIYWIYTLVGSGILCTIGFGAYHFFKLVRSNPVKAIKSISGAILLILIMAVSWHIGSGIPLDIPNYTGSSNTYFWLKATDMYLYTTYFLLGLSILTIIGFRICQWIKP